MEIILFFHLECLGIKWNPTISATFNQWEDIIDRMVGNPSYCLFDVTAATCDQQSLRHCPQAPLSVIIVQSDVTLWLHLPRVIVDKTLFPPSQGHLQRTELLGSLFLRPSFSRAEHSDPSSFSNLLLLF